MGRSRIEVVGKIACNRTRKVRNLSRIEKICVKSGVFTLFPNVKNILN